MRQLLRTWRLWAVFPVLALASALAERSGADAETAKAAAHEFANLGDAVYSTPDLDMFQSLASSVKGHEALLEPETPYTVFAPRNVAFARFPKAVLDDIWIPGNTRWAGVFWHHVARGNYRLGNLKDGQVLEQLDGSPVRISVSGGRLAVDGVPVVDTLVTRTSVIYVIDSILLPEAARKELEPGSPESSATGSSDRPR